MVVWLCWMCSCNNVLQSHLSIELGQSFPDSGITMVKLGQSGEGGSFQGLNVIIHC